MIYDCIQADIKTAMKEKNVVLKDVLKQVQAKAQAEAKDKKVDMSDDIVISAINKELKQLNQTLDSIKSKPESDLFHSTTEKIVILKGYLPEQMTEEEVLDAVKKIVSDNSNITGGKLIGIVMKELKGKADNKLIRECIDKLS